MIITVNPEDLIKRCLWSDYKRFVLKSKSEQQNQLLVKENKPIVLSENDAYAIGLLKVIETDNLVHRFTVHMRDMINIKSTIFEKTVYISVRVIENELENFKKRFPHYWKTNSTWETSMEELISHIDGLIETVKSVDIHEFKIKDKTVRYHQSKDIKKMIG